MGGKFEPHAALISYVPARTNRTQVYVWTHAYDDSKAPSSALCILHGLDDAASTLLSYHKTYRLYLTVVSGRLLCRPRPHRGDKACRLASSFDFIMDTGLLQDTP